MRADQAMPPPPDITYAAGRVAEQYDAVYTTIISTQVAQHHGDGVPGWVGQSADAYLSSISQLGDKTRLWASVFPKASEAVLLWREAVSHMLKASLPDLWDRYDRAIAIYEQGVAEIEKTLSLARDNRVPAAAGEEMIDAPSRLNTLTVARDNTIKAIYDEYLLEMFKLDRLAQETADKISALEDSIVPPSHRKSREEIGANLFNDIAILDGQAEYDYAQKNAAGAAHLINSPHPSTAQFEEFANTYSESLSNPFFAHALAERVSPEQLLKFFVTAENHRGQIFHPDGTPNTDFDADLDKLSSSLGTLVTLSLGGINATPVLNAENEAFYTTRAGLLTQDGTPVTQLHDTHAKAWQQLGRQLIDPLGTPTHGDRTQGGELRYGYEYLAPLLSLAARTNPDLALGPAFFEGPAPLAHDIVAFDHEHGNQISQTGGYHNWHPRVPGGGALATDPVEAMLRLMDHPTHYADFSGPLAQENSDRFAAVQRFLAGDTGFSLDPEKVPDSRGDDQPDPMMMARYLTGFRRSDLYTGTQDFGDSLGLVLAQAAATDPVPMQLDPATGKYVAARATPEFLDWAAKDERAVRIAAGFMHGYQDGLDINNDVVDGENVFGRERPALRNWAGTILAPHVEGLAKSLKLSGVSYLDVAVPQADHGHLISFSDSFKERIIGSNGIFNDMAFDTTGFGSRETAIGTLQAVASQRFGEELGEALQSWEPSPGIPDHVNMDIVNNSINLLQNDWAALMDILTSSPGDASQQAAAAQDAHNARLKTLFSEGLGLIPATKTGTGPAISSLLNLALGADTSGALEHILAENNAELARAQTAEDHERLENTSLDMIYQAISENHTWWGTDPARQPAEFIEFYQVGNFLDSQGNIIPYHQMDKFQAEGFRQFLNGDAGAGPMFKPIFTGWQEALDSAKVEREE